MRKVVIGSDHVGFPLKQAVAKYLIGQGIEIIDTGPDNEVDPVDYPTYAQKVAWSVVSGEADFGVVLCGTGLGVSIAANKVPGARAALCTDVYAAHQARAHNDANILAMGAWVVTPQRMTGILDEWLRTSFEFGRHVPRLQMLDRYFSPQNQPVFPLDCSGLRFTTALSIQKTIFGPLLFAGDFDAGLRALAEEGFSDVEISLRDVDDLSYEDLAARLKAYGLRLTAFATGQGCLHDSLCLAATDPFLHERAIARLKDITRLASRFEAGVILGGVRGRLTGSLDEQLEQRAGAVEAIRECARYAESLGTPVYFEPINHYETNFVNTTAEGLAFLDEIGVSSMRLLLDTYHMNIEEVDLVAAVTSAGHRLGYLHLVDSNRQAPGHGHLDLRAVLAAAIQCGFAGVVSAEILPLPDDRTALRRTGETFRKLGADLREPIAGLPA